jgi:hypothetical protein
MDYIIDTRLDTESTRAFLTQELVTANERLSNEQAAHRATAARLTNVEALFEFAFRTQGDDLATITVRDFRRVMEHDRWA